MERTYAVPVVEEHIGLAPFVVVEVAQLVAVG